MFICLSFPTFQNVIKKKRNIKLSYEIMEATLCWDRLCWPAPRWWAGMWQAASSYGVEFESLNSCLPSSPGWDAFSPALSHSHSTPTMNIPQSSLTASFGPLGPRQEKPPSCAHSLLPVFHLLLSIFPWCLPAWPYTHTQTTCLN